MLSTDFLRIAWAAVVFVFDSCSCGDFVRRQSPSSRSVPRVRVGRSCALAGRPLPDPSLRESSRRLSAAPPRLEPRTPRFCCDRLDRRRRSDQKHVLRAPGATSNCTPGSSLRPRQRGRAFGFDCRLWEIADSWSGGLKKECLFLPRLPFVLIRPGRARRRSLCAAGRPGDTPRHA